MDNPIKRAPFGFDDRLRFAFPLLEQERGPAGLALIPQAPEPIRAGWPVAGAAFAAGDDPMQS